MKVGLAVSFFDQTLRESKSRELIPAQPPRGPAVVRSSGPIAESSTSPFPATSGSNPRTMSPRQMSELSMDLYLGGTIGFEEYELLAFQPELHPDYNETVGALTGRAAEPDRPRDIVAEWEKRLDFEQKHAGDTPDRLRLATRIVSVLSQVADGTNVTI